MSENPAIVSDGELARQSQAGSPAAFEELVYRYERRVMAFVTQFCRNTADARELTQDTFVKAFQSIEQFDPSRDFAAWLFTIARRKCIDRHRATPPATDATIHDIADDSDPSEAAARREDGEDLWRLARESLTENQFMALWLHYAEDMEVIRIAQVLGKSRVHVKVLLFRARQTLGRELKPSLVVSRAMSGLGHPATNETNQSTKIPPTGKVTLSGIL